MADPSPAATGDSPRVLCLHGSPRPGGNTDLLLDALAEGVEAAGGQSEHLYARSLEAAPCVGCGACAQTGVCPVPDAMGAVYAAVDRAAAVAVAAPVYFLGIPGRCKGLIDRFQCRWSRRYLLGQLPGPVRPGAFLSAAGAPSHSVFSCALRSVEALFDTLGVVCRSNLLYENVDSKGAIAAHPTALDEARAAGALLVEIARGQRK